MPELRRVIGDGAGTPDAEVDGLDDAGLLDIHRSMVLLRTYDERSLTYHRQGRIGTYAIFWGTEAIQAGSVHALEADDWVFPSYRESAIGLVRGMAPATILAWWRGHPAGWWDPRERKVASICVPIATHVPHAAGLAWGLRLRGERSCAVCYFGDGATSEGDVPRGSELRRRDGRAARLLCNNNGWAISTPLEAQTRAVTLADKAAGYGMPGVRVDGGDVLAIYDATREAVARARAGEGPTLIEAVTYRMAPARHRRRPALYIDEARVEEERRNECLVRYEALPAPPRHPDRRAGRAVRADALAAMREGIAAAEALPRARSRARLRHRLCGPAAAASGRAARASGRLSPRTAHEDARRGGERRAPHRDGARCGGDGHGRGRRRAGRRLPRDRRPARPVRARPLRRHAARGGGHPRRGRGPRMAGFRPVCEMQYDAFS